MSLIPVATRYSQHRADSGRIASGTDPSDEEKQLGRKPQQLQNVPRALRNIFVPPPGHLFVGADWAGIEWAIMVWLASKYTPTADRYHEQMLDRFFAGEFDPHCWLAAVAFSLDYEDLFRRHRAGEKLKPRKMAKPYVHGYDYDGAPAELARANGHSEGIGIKVCAAHDEAFRLRPLKTFLVEMATENGWAQTEAGFRRYFWEPVSVRNGKQMSPKPAEILAHFGSGNAADLCKYVLGRAQAAMPEGHRFRTTTHDSFLLEAPEAGAASAASWMKAQMEQPIPFLGGRRWRADVKVGSDWRQAC